MENAPRGGVLNARILWTFSHAYALYGLAEHFRATGNTESLKATTGLFRTLEDIVHDKEKGGYIETFSRDWGQSDSDGVDGMKGARKTMNTHIHLLEAYTALLESQTAVPDT